LGHSPRVPISRRNIADSQNLFNKLPIFYLPKGDTTKSPEDQEVKEREVAMEEEEDDDEIGGVP
jgi:hypothetical protein